MITKRNICALLQPTRDISQQARNVQRIGWCVPESCSPVLLEEYLNDYTTNVSFPLHENITYDVEVPEKWCQQKDDQKAFSAPDIIFW